MTGTVLVILPPGVGAAVHCIGALSAIQIHHQPARIAALVDPTSADFVRTIPHIDEVFVDDQAPWWRWRDIKRLQTTLRATPFVRVYDFSDGARSELLLRLMHGWRLPSERRSTIAWSGPVAGTALPHDNPNRAAMHLVDRLNDQLRSAGLDDAPPPDLSWVARQVRSFTTPFKMNEPYVLLALDPGPRGNWPTESIIQVAEWLAVHRLVPVLAGLNRHAETAAAICAAVPRAVDITGAAPAGDLVFLAWGATVALGPDSDVMTLIGSAGCRSVVLCDGGSDPALRGPRGPHMSYLRRQSIAEISLSEIVALIGARVRGEPSTPRP